MQKMLILAFLLTFCGSSLFASATDKKQDEQKKSTQPKRYIIQKIVQQPECKPEDRTKRLNKDLQQASDRFVKKYAPILPTFAAMVHNSGCLYAYYTAHNKQTPAGLPYYEFPIICIECKYNPTFFHIPLRITIKRGPKTIPQIMPKEVGLELHLQAQNLGFDTTQGMFVECSMCKSAEFITREDPSTLTSKTAAEAVDEFYV
jgi:hypothetical protein